MVTVPNQFSDEDIAGIDDALSILDESVYDTVDDLILGNPLDWVVLTNPQYEYVSKEDPEAAWVDGNQLGKSYALAFDILHIARGTHPFRKNRPGAVEIVCISVSFEQMEPLMAKLWQLVPKGEIDPDTSFTKGRGITGKPPRIVFVSGPGKGSVIKFATYKQGTTRIAGLTADYVAMDEPPEESLYGEIKPRLLRKRGDLRITMTPTPDMPVQTWYKKKVEAGEVGFVNRGLTEATVTPAVWANDSVGEWLGENLDRCPPFPNPFLTQAEIDKYEDQLLDAEREMRMRGAWTAAVTGRWVPNFSEPTHVRRLDLNDLGGWYLAVGCDHGTQEGKQSAVLVALNDRGTDRPKVRILDETWQEGLTKPEDDAQDILEMLARHGLSYGDVDNWVGDVPAGSVRHEVRKSNADLRREFARILGIRLAKVRSFKVPKKGRNSMTYGVMYLNTLFGRFEDDGTPHIMVDPRCAGFIDFLNRFDGDKWHETKDVGDAGRYAIERSIATRITVR